MSDFYALLGVKSTATKSEIEKAFRKASLKYHPDKNPLGTEQFKELARIKEVLLNDTSRTEYDEDYVDSNNLNFRITGDDPLSKYYRSLYQLPERYHSRYCLNNFFESLKPAKKLNTSCEKSSP